MICGWVVRCILVWLRPRLIQIERIINLSLPGLLSSEPSTVGEQLRSCNLVDAVCSPDQYAVIDTLSAWSTASFLIPGPDPIQHAAPTRSLVNLSR